MTLQSRQCVQFTISAQNPIGVNCINILRAHFLYKSLFKAKLYAEKICSICFQTKNTRLNVDVIYAWIPFFTSFWNQVKHINFASALDLGTRTRTHYSTDRMELNCPNSNTKNTLNHSSMLVKVSFDK